MDNMNQMMELVDQWADYALDIRRKIHANPELAFHEFETSKLVAGELEKLGIPYVKSPAEPGLIATIDSGKPGKLLMLRADMDALPINEEVDVPFKSKNEGVMHACGHDVHTANLLTVGAILNQMKDSFTGRVRLVFQPAEERGGGGREMVKKGLMDEVPDRCLAIHVGSEPQGLITVGRGYRTAYSDGCNIKVHGKAAHSSKPQDGVDAILIASHIVQAINTISSRSVDPEECSTINVGVIKGGRAPNIVSDEVEIMCMMRNARPEPRQDMFRRLREICPAVASAFGGSCDVDIFEGYPAVYNDPAVADFMCELVEKNKDALYRDIDDQIPAEYLRADPPQIMGAEDFGFFAQKAPSCFIKIGTGEYAPQHNQKFQVDERYIKLCTRLMALAALEFLK